MAKYCTNCGSLLNENTGICPNCGTNNNASVKQNFSLPINNQKSTNKTKSFLIVAIGVVLIALLVGVILKNILKSPTYSSSFVINYDKTRTEYAYDSDGNLLQTTERTYDKKERFEEVTSYNSSGKITSRSEREFNKKGWVVTLYNYDSDSNKISRTTEYEYEYDSKKRPVSAKIISSDSDSPLIAKFKYDKKGNMTEVRHYQDGEFLRRFVFTYDEKGKLESQEVYDKDGNLSYYYEYEVDKNNRILTSQLYNSDEAKGTYTEIEYED